MSDFRKLKEDCVDEASRLSNEVENIKGKCANNRHSEGFERLCKVTAARLKVFHAMGCSSSDDLDKIKASEHAKELIVDSAHLKHLSLWEDTEQFAKGAFAKAETEEALKEAVACLAPRKEAAKNVLDKTKHTKKEVESRSAAIKKETLQKAASASAAAKAVAKATTPSHRGAPHGGGEDESDVFTFAYSVAEQMPVYDQEKFRATLGTATVMTSSPYIVCQATASGWAPLLASDDELTSKVPEFCALFENSPKTMAAGRAQLPTSKGRQITVQMLAFSPSTCCSVSASAMLGSVATALTMMTVFGFTKDMTYSGTESKQTACLRTHVTGSRRVAVVSYDCARSKVMADLGCAIITPDVVINHVATLKAAALSTLAQQFKLTFGILQARDVMYVPVGVIAFEKTPQQLHGYGFSMPLIAPGRHRLAATKLLAQDLNTTGKSPEPFVEAIKHTSKYIAAAPALVSATAPEAATPSAVAHGQEPGPQSGPALPSSRPAAAATDSPAAASATTQAPIKRVAVAIGEHWLLSSEDTPEECYTVEVTNVAADKITVVLDGRGIEESFTLEDEVRFLRKATDNEVQQYTTLERPTTKAVQ